MLWSLFADAEFPSELTFDTAMSVTVKVPIEFESVFCRNVSCRSADLVKCFFFQKFLPSSLPELNLVVFASPHLTEWNLTILL